MIVYILLINYLFLSATNAANAIEFTFVSKLSALDVKITGADVPTNIPPFIYISSVL